MRHYFVLYVCVSVCICAFGKMEQCYRNSVLNSKIRIIWIFKYIRFL